MHLGQLSFNSQDIWVISADSEVDRARVQLPAMTCLKTTKLEYQKNGVRKQKNKNIQYSITDRVISVHIRLQLGIPIQRDPVPPPNANTFEIPAFLWGEYAQPNHIQMEKKYTIKSVPRVILTVAEILQYILTFYDVCPDILSDIVFFGILSDILTFYVAF